MSKDNINPDHYKQGDIECIDAMVAAYGEEAVRIYCKLAAFKYGWRRGLKGDEAQDVKKQQWYLDRSLGIDPREIQPNEKLLKAAEEMPDVAMQKRLQSFFSTPEEYMKKYIYNDKTRWIGRGDAE